MQPQTERQKRLTPTRKRSMLTSLPALRTSKRCLPEWKPSKRTLKHSMLK
jgi:hypothetical protein